MVGSVRSSPLSAEERRFITAVFAVGLHQEQRAQDMVTFQRGWREE